MADVRVRIPDEVMASLREPLGLRTNNEVIQEALTLLVWAAEEAQRGRMIVSVNPDGRDLERLAMQSLERKRPPKR